MRKPNALAIIFGAGVPVTCLALFAAAWLLRRSDSPPPAPTRRTALPVETKPSAPAEPTLDELQAERRKFLDALVIRGVFKSYTEPARFTVTIGPLFRGLPRDQQETFVSVYFAWVWRTTPNDSLKWVPDLDERGVIIEDEAGAIRGSYEPKKGGLRFH